MHFKKTLVILVMVVFAGFLSLSFSFLGGILDLTDLYNYVDQDIPEFIMGDNTPVDNQMTDEIATLGRVLFYDKQLSLNAQVSCASCHKQEFAFGDTSVVSKGFDGQLTERHAPRLLNMSFNEVDSVFFDHRAGSLEEQPLMTLANSIEMGFSGQNGQPTLDSLINRLTQLDYYKNLFEFAYGNEQVTQERVSKALSQFVRSIVSFDSKYDEGRALVNNDFQDFPNFTAQENFGKSLFISPFPQIVGANEVNPPPVMFFGCANCHENPTFSQSRSHRGNNGVLGVAGDTTLIDISVIRAPSIRNVMRPDGIENGPFMHDGSLANLREVLNHYTFVPYNPENTNLSNGMGGTVLQFDHRRPMSQEQEDALMAFMFALSGTDIYENPKWSNPFDENDQLNIREEPCDTEVAEVTITAQHCEGEITLGYSMEGTYLDTLVCSMGCDSIRTLVLSVYPSYEQDFEVEICEGESYQGYTQEGIYTENLQTAEGCDSILTLFLSVYPSYEQDFEVEICEGESYQGYTQEGIYIERFQSNLGCDSLINLILAVNDVYEITLEESVCEGDSIMGFSEPGLHEIQLETHRGCDSIVLLDLNILPTYTDTSYVEICVGEEYEGYTTTGQYTTESVSAEGCDSIQVLDLMVLPDSDPDCLESSVAGVETAVIDIYPNPVVDLLYVRKNGTLEFSIEVYSIDGQLVLTRKLSKPLSRLDLSEIGQGAYVLMISNTVSGGTETHKIFKM